MTTQQKEESRPKDETVYKYSNKGQGQLREAGIIEGRPYLIRYNQEKGFIQVQEKITDIIPILRPPLREEYPYSPYEFKTVNEPQKYLMLAMQETPDTLLAKIKIMVKNFNDVSEHTANLLSLTTFNSYFQDRFSTVYYHVVVGANGTGKSAFGDTFECLGYRAVKVTNATDTFFFRIFGTSEYGQVTIIAEEFDRMDESGQTMAVIKDGYQPNIKVPRMISDNSKMEFFYPFGFKIIIAEKSPNDYKSRGVLDRSFKTKTYKGFPKYKIKEIRNAQGNVNRQKLFDEMEHLRKLLFMYRLIHIKDPYKEINVGLDGRDEELCKPTLQLFVTLGASKETIKMIESTFQHFLNTKNDRKKDLLETTIYPIVKDMVTPDKLSVSGTDIWEKITSSLDGHLDNDDPNLLFYSDVFGKIFRQTLTKIICDKFGAEIDHKEKGNNLLFDYGHLINMEKIYKNEGIIKTELVEPDCMIRQSPPDGCGNESDNDNSESKNDSSDDGDTSQDESDHSSNQPDVIKDNITKVGGGQISFKQCPISGCDYQCEPYSMKFHLEGEHGIVRQQPQIREAVPNREGGELE